MFESRVYSNLICDSPKNQRKLRKLLYKIGENIEKQLKALSHDPVIGF